MQNWGTRLIISLVAALNYLTTSGALGSGDKVDALFNLPALTYIGFFIALLTGWVSPSVVKAVGSKVKTGAAASFLLAALLVPVAFVSVGSLQGCATTAPIDTYNKKVAAFEITYNEALKTAKLWLDSSTTPQPIKDSIKAAISDIRDARTAMEFAEGAGDLRTAEGQLKTAQSALRVLRKIVETKQNE